MWGILLKNIISSMMHGTLSNLFAAQRYALVKSGYINATHARDPISLSMPSAEMFFQLTVAPFAKYRIEFSSGSAPHQGSLPIPASQHHTTVISQTDKDNPFSAHILISCKLRKH